MSLTDDIKDYALDLGYAKVGITGADGFPDYAAELKSRYDMYSWYIDSPRQPILGAMPKKDHAFGQIHRHPGLRLRQTVLSGKLDGQDRSALSGEVLQRPGTADQRGAAPVDA